MADGSPRRLGVDAGVPSGRQSGTRRSPLPGESGLVLREGADGSVDVQFAGCDGEILREGMRAAHSRLGPNGQCASIAGS
jgi:hypothetical protein